jgi:hypothetical protein
MSVSEALACTSVEKLNPLERKSAPGISADVTSLAVATDSFVHVPLPIVVEPVVENLHSAALEDVEQEPAYTEISPAEDIEGMNAVELSLVNGKLDVIVSIEKFDWKIGVYMLKEASWCASDAALGRKTYAMSLLLDELEGSRMVVGL